MRGMGAMAGRGVRIGLAAAFVLLAALGTGAEAQRSAKKKTPTLTPPKPHNRFITVIEFRKARRPAGTIVSVEGYILSALKSGRRIVTLEIVDSTDQVLSAADAQKTARGGIRSSVTVPDRAHPLWTLTSKGLLRLSMYTGAARAARVVQDAPPKVRVQGLVGKPGATLSRLQKIEYQNADGDWKELR